MLLRVPTPPSLFVWARERAGLDKPALTARFPLLDAWESGTATPTLHQLEQYAQATHAPIGAFLLPEPPSEVLPVMDFRTMRRPDGSTRPRVTADLLDVIYSCQARQAWYREEAQAQGETPLTFVGSLTTEMPAATAAALIREALSFSVQARGECPTWTEALRLFITQAERLGVLVMVSGVVMNNHSRPLDAREFRGFTLADPLAPLVFINGADGQAAQMFTLAHELAHLWLGQSGVSDVEMGEGPDQDVERWCDQVAAELLVPRDELLSALNVEEPVRTTLQRLAQHFKVSTLVILRRMRDVGAMDPSAFRSAFVAEEARLKAQTRRGTGSGDFYRTALARVSQRFAQRLVASTLEGRTLYRDAFRMLGIAKTATFNELGRALGFAM